MIAHHFPPLILKNKRLLPVLQGGMGVGISAHRLAGSVAKTNAVGTISAVDLRRHHPDLMQERQRDMSVDQIKTQINAANLIALDREIKAAKELAADRGMIAVNVMRAVTEYAEYTRQACESGADAIVMGAGLPLDLPDITKDFPDVALIPILSDVRGIAAIVRKWGKKGRLPDAIIIEHPKHAGGHLGATKLKDIDDPRFDFERVIPEALEFFRSQGLDDKQIALIPAGGINSHERVHELIRLGADAVQLGTAFAVSEESDAHLNFKHMLADAAESDMVEFMSTAGLPARAIRSPWLDKYLRIESKLTNGAHKRARCSLRFDCLIQCGLRDGLATAGQFCIDNHLAAAMHGDVRRGLFFRGAGKLPFGERIRPVSDLITYLLTGTHPANESTLIAA